MQSLVSDNPRFCQITYIQIISNLLNYESNVSLLVKRGP